MKLNQEQSRKLALRDYYAQGGINLDKATTRFLETHGGAEDRDTLRLIPVEAEKLRLQTVNPQ